MQKFMSLIKKSIANTARKAASMEANSACPLLSFQSKVPQNVKKLRKF